MTIPGREHDIKRMSLELESPVKDWILELSWLSSKHTEIQWSESKWPVNQKYPDWNSLKLQINSIRSKSSVKQEEDASISADFQTEFSASKYLSVVVQTLLFIAHYLYCRYQVTTSLQVSKLGFYRLSNIGKISPFS